ncbi:hypothetical protein D3C72_1509110 [compost metagenome]
MKEPPVHALALHHAHRAGVAVRQHGFGCACGDRLETLRNIVQRLVPADGCELPAADLSFWADALERREHSLGVVAAFGVLADLGAQHAVGVRVRRIALYAGGHAVFYGGEQGAGVRTVVRTGSAHLNRHR